MKIAIYGPNLNRAGQEKGTLHIHSAGCGHSRQYGNRGRYGGDRADGSWTVDATSCQEVIEEIYGDHIAESEEQDWREYDGDIWFAPCVGSLSYAAGIVLNKD